MGVDSADFNQDGWMDLFVANIDHETYSLYRTITTKPLTISPCLLELRVRQTNERLGIEIL